MKMKFCLPLLALAALAGPPHESRGQSALRPREFRAPSDAYELTALVRKLRGVKAVTASAVGFASAKGEFFKLSEEILRVGTAEDFKRMAEDENVVVRVMGLVCLAQLGVGQHGEVLRSHLHDASGVALTVGCIRHDTTVGEIARRLLADPNFLGHEDQRASRARAAHD